MRGRTRTVKVRRLTDSSRGARREIKDLDGFRTESFGSAMRPRIAFILQEL